ncbi:unnamed protein product, partial [Brachionus calyciflorus]
KDVKQSWLMIDEVGHEYKVGYEATSGLITWRCNNSQFPNFPGKATTNGYNKSVTFKVPHEHAPSIKTKEKGLVTDFPDLQNSENSVRLYCKMFPCLAFIPVDHVVDGFIELKNNAPNKVKDII